MAELAGVKRACYLVLSGYTKYDTWEKQLQKLVKPLNLGNGTFTTDHIKMFCEELQEVLLAKDIAVDFNAMYTSLLSTVQDHIAIGPENVEAVGEKVTEWFQEFENKLRNEEDNE